MKKIFFIVVILSLCFIDITHSGCHGKVDTDRTEFSLDEAESIDVAVVKTTETDFQKKMKALSGNKITEEVVATARKAYDKLPLEMKKAEDDTRIKAYEALVPTRNAKQIKSALDQYSNQYTTSQRYALEKISYQMGYDKYLKETKAQNKPYIDIQLINKILKDE